MLLRFRFVKRILSRVPSALKSFPGWLFGTGSGKTVPKDFNRFRFEPVTRFRQKQR